MNKLFARSILAALLAAAAGVWAADVGTSISNVGNESPDQALGSFTITFDEDAFPNAGVDTPVYIRFRLNRANGWARTLVDLRPGAPDPVRRPINIALYPTSNHTLNPGLPPTAVQLVRLIEGELAGWLRVSFPSSQWALNDGAPAPPSGAKRVSFTVGVRGKNSERDGANTSSGGNETPSGLLISTILRADYQNTPDFGVGDLETLDFIAFDSSTQGVEAGASPVPGPNLGVGFSNDSAIARGDANIPCFEFHFQPDEFDGLPPKLGVNRLNLVFRNAYCANSPPVYLTNSSDFEWTPGSRFYLTLNGYNPSFLVTGAPEPIFDLSDNYVALDEADISVQASNGSGWQVAKLFHQGQFVGYELILSTGELDVFDQLEIRGLRACFGDKFEGRRLLLTARAFFLHPVFSDNQLEEISEITREALLLESRPEDFSRRILPFTGHDRDDWNTVVKIFNIGEEPSLFSAFFYQRQGILTRVFSQYELAPFGSVTLDLQQLYGPQFAGSITWAELLSDGSIGAVAVVEDRDRKTLDIVPSVASSRQTLYGTHVPVDDRFWETSAYVVSSEYDLDSDYQLELPGQAPENIRALRAPRYSTVLADNDFYDAFQERSPWFRVNATAASASGVLFFGRKDNGSQLASISLDAEPVTRWSFDHLGDSANGWWNGLILLNPGKDPVKATLTGLDRNGESIAVRDLVVEGEVKVVDFVSALLQLTAQPTPSRLEIVSDAPIVASMLFGRQDTEVLTNVPGNLPERNRAVMPWLPRDEEDWGGVALTNLRQRTIRVLVTPVRADGSQGDSASVDLGPGEKALFLLKDLIGEPWQYDQVLLESGGPFRFLGLTGNFTRGQMATVPGF